MLMSDTLNNRIASLYIKTARGTNCHPANMYPDLLARRHNSLDHISSPKAINGYPDLSVFRVFWEYAQ